MFRNRVWVRPTDTLTTAQPKAPSNIVNLGPLAMDFHHVPVGIGVWGAGNAAIRGLWRPDLGAVNDPHKRTIR